jgi:hypothetical protein
MVDATFNPQDELSEVKTLRALQRRKQYQKSKLERYRAELVAMRQAGASCADLATWLKTKHRMKIHRSSIDRYLSTLPELAAKSETPPPPAPEQA